MPVWITVGGTPASVHRSAQYGLPIILAIIRGMPRQFIPLVEYYQEQYRAFRHDPKKIQTGVHSNTFIADSKDEILEYFYPGYAARMDKIGTERGWRRSFTKSRFLAGTRPEGVLFMGNWEEVAEKSFN